MGMMCLGGGRKEEGGGVSKTPFSVRGGKGFVSE